MPLYYCEHCGKEVLIKYGSGRFCSRACANARIRTEETKRKIAEGCKGKFQAWKNAHPDEWKKTYEKIRSTKKQNAKLKTKTIQFVSCAYCGKNIDMSTRRKNSNNRYFCNGTCRNLLLNATKEIGGIHNGASISRWEKIFQDVLTRHGIEFEANKRDLLASHLEIDIWLPKYRTAIELNGIWHYSTKPYNGDEEALRKKQEKDALKKSECLSLGYRFFVIKDCEVQNRQYEQYFESFVKENILRPYA